MRIRYVLGPAGSGKTFHCLEEIRRDLLEAADGPPLLLIAPKQSTYQLERRLLEAGTLAGYTRLQIVSFERLARWAFQRAGRIAPAMLNDQGRVMVLRGLLARSRQKLQLFRGSAHLSGFAEQLSAALLDIQLAGVTPDSLRTAAAQARPGTGLGPKLTDLAFLLEQYVQWLEAHHLSDAGVLFETAARALAETPADEAEQPRIWVDGFVEFSGQELGLLKEVVRHSDEAVLTFCLDGNARDTSWLSCWSVTRRNFERCRQHLDGLSSHDPAVEVLSREASAGRFTKSPGLRYLEHLWADAETAPAAAIDPGENVAAFLCGSPEEEAVVAAREILRHVRAGGRYRDACVLVRSLEPYHESVRRVFARYEIPFFLDRRETIAHHPLAELTRSALRTIAFDWRRDDWFAALKTGLVPVDEATVDRLENEALARGWRAGAWHRPLAVPDDPELTAWLAEVQAKLLPPFQRLASALAAVRHQPDGPQLAAALREFWGALAVEETLANWALAESAGGDTQVSGSVHLTVWDQMKLWVENVELAFAGEALGLREWLPVLESGLASLTVGIIPPVLDQVLIGAADRRRNPEVELALVLGLNEGVFPARPAAASLLNESDRLELERLNLDFCRTMRTHLARERHLAYLAFTRARQRLVLTRSSHDAKGAGLNPSPLVGRFNQLFPALEPPRAPAPPADEGVLHASEIVGPLYRAGLNQGAAAPWLQPWLDVPAVSAAISNLRRLGTEDDDRTLGPELASRLYGTVLRTSVSRMEQFAACPFQFYVRSGLRAEERKRFELDARERGSFQHEVLARFHQELRKQKLRWRDVMPGEARDRVERIARALAPHYGGGLLESNEIARFQSRVLGASLQDFVEVLVGWMRGQYAFDPVEVELPFGLEGKSPPWMIALEGGRRLELNGRIDRVDLWREAESGSALCVVVDYKSSPRQLDSVLVQHGVQLQLLGYLNVLRHWPDPRRWFGVERLEPAGVFYVNLRGSYKGEQNRNSALSDPERDRKLAYRHVGRFDTRALGQLDCRAGVTEGDQFNFRLNEDGSVHGNCREALTSEGFEQLLGQIEENLRRMGQEVFSGLAAVSPFRKGTQTACGKCEYAAICRMDPWTGSFRVLSDGARQAPGGETVPVASLDSESATK